MQCTYVFIRASAQLCAIHKLIHGGDETDGFIYSEGIDSGHCYKCVTMRVCVCVVVVVFSDKSLLACRTVSPHLCKRTPEGNRFICKRTILLPLLPPPSPPPPHTHTHKDTGTHTLPFTSFPVFTPSPPHSMEMDGPCPLCLDANGL